LETARKIADALGDLARQARDANMDMLVDLIECARTEADYQAETAEKLKPSAST